MLFIIKTVEILQGELQIAGSLSKVGLGVGNPIDNNDRYVSSLHDVRLLLITDEMALLQNVEFVNLVV